MQGEAPDDDLDHEADDLDNEGSIYGDSPMVTVSPLSTVRRRPPLDVWIAFGFCCCKRC